MTLDTFTNKTLVKFVFLNLERLLLLIKLHDPNLVSLGPLDGQKQLFFNAKYGNFAL